MKYHLPSPLTATLAYSLFLLTAFSLRAGEPAPLASFAFEGDVTGITSDGRNISGNALIRAPFIDGVHGKAVVVKRWAYDQKASIGWSGVTIPRAATLTVQIKPLWEGPRTPHDLVEIISSGGEITLGMEASGVLALRLNVGATSERVELPSEVLAASRFNPVAITFDLDRGQFSLEAGGRRAEGRLAKPAAYSGLLRAPADLRLGGLSTSITEGDAADSAFDDLKIYAGCLREMELTAALAAPAQSITSGPVVDDSATWLARFAAEKPTPYENGIWSLEGADTLGSATRREICLNGLWRFAPAVGDQAGASQRLYSRLPGTWLYKGGKRPADAKFFVIDGETGKPLESVGSTDLQTCFRGWYRRQITLPLDFAGRRLALKVKHVGAAKARFFVNGQFVGVWEKKGRYDQGLMQNLRFDLTRFTRAGQLDLAVEIVFEGPSAAGRIALIDASLERVDSAILAGKPRITTAVNAGLLTVAGQVTPSAEGALLPGLTAEAVVCDPNGKTVLTLPAVPVAADGSYRLEGKAGNLVCWSPENPQLYTASVRVRNAAKAVLDESTPERFGWRELVMGENRFVLNGSKFRVIYDSDNFHLFGSRFAGHTSQPQAAHAIVAALRDAGYNTIVVEAVWNKDESAYFPTESPIWQESMVKACDEMGMLVVFKVPEFLPGTDAAAYHDAFANIVKFWGNHPSIAFWLDDFNKCFYTMLQHPSMVNDYNYVSASRAAMRQSILQGDAIISELDPSRIIYHNAGGNISKLYTTMQYMSFGLALQEREDWPSRWERKNLYMPTEFGFPYNDQFLDFGNPRYHEKSREMILENAARYFGEDIYAQSSSDANKISPIRGAENMNPLRNDVAGDVLTPEFGNIKKLLASNSIRAWRGYDISGMGIFHEDEALWQMPYIQGAKWTTNWKDGPSEAESKRFGIHPNSIALETRYGDITRPTDYLPVFRRALSPLVAYIVHEGPRWNAKDHAYFAGETLKKQVMVLNDSLKKQDLSLAVTVSGSDGKDLLAFERKLTVDAGERTVVPVETVMPSVEARTELKIQARLTREGKEVWSEEFPLQLFPSLKAQPQTQHTARIALYDPKGNTAAVLARMGVKARPITRVEQLGDANTLVIGREALGAKPDSLLAAVERSGAIQRGLNLVIFEQKQCGLGDLIFQEERQRVAFVTNPSHPVLAGLSEKDFANWRGTTDLCVDLDKPECDWDGKLWIYPTFKYTCGSLGIVASNVIRKPVYGSFESILSCGFDLANSPLAEIRSGKGRVVLCQLDVTSRYGTDPVATRMLGNLMDYADKMAQSAPAPSALQQWWNSLTGKAAPKPTFNPIRVGVCDPGNLLGPITAFSSGAVALDSLDRLDGLNVVVVCGTGQEQLKKATGAIAAFTARGGKLVVLGRPADGPLSWSPVPITAKTVKGVRSLVKHNPAMPAWISNADLYFRTERPASAFSAQGATFLDDRETIASIPAGQGRIYLLGYEPADFTPVPIELGKAYYRTTKVPTYFDTLEPDGLLQGTSYTSFIDQLVALKPIRLVHCILDDLGVFNSQPLFTSTTRQNGKVGDEPFSIEVTDWKFRLDPENIGLKSGWQRGEGQGWADIKLSLAWEKQGYTQPNPHYLIAPNGKRDDAGQYNGFAWYGAQVNVPASAKEAGPLHLEIEGVDDFDTTYINGNPVGHTGNETPNAPAVARHYNLRADSLFFGARNTITIQVEDVYAEGMVKGPVRIVASRKNDAKAALPYPANYPILDLNAFHNW